MKKITRKIAMIFMVILFANMFTGCTMTVAQERAAARAVGGFFEDVGEIVKSIVDVGSAIGDAVSAAAYEKAAKAAEETVKQYDEVDTF